MLVTRKCSRLSKSWTKAYSNGDNCHYLICSFSAFSGSLSTKIFKKRSTAEHRASLFLPAAYFARSDVFEVWVKKKNEAKKNKNGNTERNPQRWQKRCWNSSCSLTSSTFQRSLAGRDSIQGLWLESRTMAVHCHTPPYQHISTSEQAVKGILSASFSIQCADFACNRFIENWLHLHAQELLEGLCASSFHVITSCSQLENYFQVLEE